MSYCSCGFYYCAIFTLNFTVLQNGKIECVVDNAVESIHATTMACMDCFFGDIFHIFVKYLFPYNL